MGIRAVSDIGVPLRATALAAVVGLASLTLGACGSSGSGSSSATTAGASSGATDITTPSSITEPTVVVGGAKFCQQLVDEDEKLTTSVSGLVSGQQAASAVVSTYQTLANEAPAAIKPQVQNIATGLKNLVAAIKNPSAAASAGQAFANSIGPDEEAIGTWAGSNCHAG